jgi:5-hydroxyisourate hydrolase
MISTHVLDTSRGRPAAGVPVVLEHAGATIMRAETDADGRVRELVPAGTAPEAGDYRLSFDTGAYFAALGAEGFYPRVVVEFTLRDPAQHHHVPLLLSAYGYSTYRGS